MLNKLILKYIILVKSYTLSILREMITSYRQGTKEADFYKIYVTDEDKKAFSSEEVKYVADYFRKQRIHCISLYDANYPESLKEIYDPPPVFLYRGKLELLRKKRLGIVGSRKAPEDYLKLAYRIGSLAADNGWTTVSGLARGVDIYSQKGSLGTTIAVLGTGLDINYPREHCCFQQQISCFSEFPLGMKPLPYHFPRRNRIISGLSQGLVVVYGEKGSGSFITLDLGVEEGRDIFVTRQVEEILGESYGNLQDLEHYIIGKV